MDVCMGVCGKDYALIVTDSSQTRSIVVTKRDEDKILQLDSSKLLGIAGPAGDRYQFGEYIQKNIHLYKLRTDVNLTTHAAANFTRSSAFPTFFFSATLA